MDAAIGPLDRARLLVAEFAARAAQHDRDASFPFENFDRLSEAGLLALPVARGFGGQGAGALELVRVLGLIAQGDAATALVLSMHYIQHYLLPRDDRFPLHLTRRLSTEAARGVALINALRVEPELGSPARGGLPATTASRQGEHWLISGRKIYSTGAPILKYYLVWATTDEPEPRVGSFLVPAGLPGTTIVETWDHLGQRASGSHDIVFDQVGVPLDHAIDVRSPAEWQAPNAVQNAIHSLFIAAIYDGVARAARNWLVDFLQQRKPANLGAALATLPRAQEALGDIEVRLAVNTRLIETAAAEQDLGGVAVSDAHAVKLTVTTNAIEAVQTALSLSSNHGLSRRNPLERHYRDVLCGRVHTPQDDSIKLAAGRAALGI
jgi:alkylation response protein AidB-like acyl-CoA dehydrogenase